MTPFRTFLCAGLAAFACCLAGCGEEETGPIAVSAIGGPPGLANPNLRPLDPPTAYLTEAVAQGLVRFENSAHMMELEEPGKMLVHLVRDVRPIAEEAGDAAPVN